MIDEEQEQEQDYIKLDYSLKTPEERNALVEKIIESSPKEKLTPRYLEILSDYIVFAMDKEEKKKKEILTDNRMVTVRKREVSYQGLADKFENGEDGLYNLFVDDKNALFTPKNSITEEDLEKIPELKTLKEEIEKIKKAVDAATGKAKYKLKKQLIEMCQDQYVIKNAYYQPSYTNNIIHSIASLDLSENITMDEKGEPHSDGLISLFNPDHISALLCNYSGLKEETWGNFQSDLYYLLEDLDNLVEETLKEEYPLYYSIVQLKIDNESNVNIKDELEKRHGVTHTVEYISSLWRNKIPKLLANKAQEKYIIWYYSHEEKGKWKKCSCCGQLKLAHNRFFSKNGTSKDGWYSICKECRNKKAKERRSKK